MPNRIFREGYLDDELVSALSDGAETLFVRLILAVDDYGRFDGRPEFIRVKCYPLLVGNDDLTKSGKRDVSVKAITARLRELARKDETGRSLATLYRVNGKPYIELHNTKQRLRQMHSKWPAPPAEPEPEPVLPLVPDPPPGPGDGAPPAEPPPPPVLAPRARAQAIAARAIDYLNEKAGTKFRHLDGTLKLPIARILEGATEADLIAVIDLKLAQALKGEFDRKYLRPATLFNFEKFANYVGQIAIKPLGPAAPAPKVKVEAWVYDQEKRITLTTFESNGAAVKPEAVAKRVAKEYGRMISGRGLRTLKVSIPGQDAAVFSIEELMP